MAIRSTALSLMLDHTKLKATVGHVVSLLAAGEYAELERLSRGERLSAGELRRAVAEYGGTVSPSPFIVDEPIAVTAEPGVWAVDVDLFTAEEGRSDLTLSLRVLESPGPHYEVQLDDLHVL